MSGAAGPEDPAAGAAPQLSVGLRTFAADGPGDWARMLDDARILDTVGVDRLVVSDHVVLGERLDAYARPELGGVSGGVQPTGPDGHWLEPLTTLSVIAGSTRRIRLGTNVLIAALRRPVVLAKCAATLDVLSDGRLDLGVGVGWQREEYDAAGLSFDDRGGLLDDALETCRRLWLDRRVSLEPAGRTVEGIHMEPKPQQVGGVPVWIAGRVHPRVVRRIARFGSGWVPWGDAADDVAGGIARMREALERVGHDPGALQVVGRLPAPVRTSAGPGLGPVMAEVPRLVDAGVTDCRLALRIPADRAEAFDTLSAAVDAFRRAAGRRAAAGRPDRPSTGEQSPGRPDPVDDPLRPTTPSD